MRGLDRRTVELRTDELLERFGMADRADLPVQGTSTGQRKRLALARALLHDPEVLFLDEPTSGLDPAATRDVIDLIGSLATEHGRTVVLCTHFLGEAGRLADRMAVLHRGVLHAFGRPEEIAATLWDGVDAQLDLGGPDRSGDRGRAPRRTAACRWWRRRRRAALVRVEDRERRAAPRPPPRGARASHVYGATRQARRRLEDVYFAVEARIARPGAEPLSSPTVEPAVDPVSWCRRCGPSSPRTCTAVRRSKASSSRCSRCRRC